LCGPSSQVSDISRTFYLHLCEAVFTLQARGRRFDPCCAHQVRAHVDLQEDRLWSQSGATGAARGVRFRTCQQRAGHPSSTGTATSALTPQVPPSLRRTLARLGQPRVRRRREPDPPGGDRLDEERRFWRAWPSCARSLAAHHGPPACTHPKYYGTRDNFSNPRCWHMVVVTARPSGDARRQRAARKAAG
jgi:hypothetical protein